MKTVNKTKRKMGTFKKDISIICSHDEMRDNLQYVLFKDGYLWATNAHVMIKQHLSLHDFTEEEIKIMDGKCIHGSAFKLMKKFDIIEATEKGLLCKGDYKVLFEYGSEDIVFPVGFQKVMDFSESKIQIDEIGVNYDYINRIKKVSMSETKQFKMEFFGKNKNIKVTPNEINEGLEVFLIMPCLIN